jgi:hypothetical protein
VHSCAVPEWGRYGLQYFLKKYDLVPMLQHLEQVPPTMHKEDEAGFSVLHFPFPI